MAGSVVDAALAVVNSAVAAGATLQQLGLKSELEGIKYDLELFEAHLTSTDEERSPDEMDRVWARQVRDIAYDLEDYIDGCRIHEANSNRSWWLWCSPYNILRLRRMVGEMAELGKKVQSAWKRRKHYRSMQLQAPPPNSEVQSAAALAPGAAGSSSSMTSWQEARRLQDVTRPPCGVGLSKLLLSVQDSSLMVVSICAEAAASTMKETLVGEAYDGLVLTGQFPCHAWVTLQHPSRPGEFIRRLLRQFQSSAREEGKTILVGGTTIVNVLQRIETMADKQLIGALDGILQHKRYLLVIDGISTREEWDSIKLYLRPDAKNSNRIIVTSPNEGVARYCAGGLRRTPFCLSDDFASLPAFCNMEFVVDEPAEAYSSVSNPENTASTSSEIVEITISSPENIAQRIRDRISRTIARNEEVAQLVGREKEMDWLVSKMTHVNNGNNNVIPIYGMSGIGKTALVRNAYYHQDVIDHFTHRAWVNISYPLNKGSLLHNILQHFKSNDHNSYLTGPLKETCIEELIEFYEVNKGNRHFRCLVVVDGLSTTQAWDLVKLSLLLENYKAVLRIIVTTREHQVAKYCCNNNTDFVFNLIRLSDNDASKLFCLKVFGRAAEVKLGEEMVKQKNQMLNKCGGIPFAIIYIGELVASKPRTAREWECINENFKLYQLPNAELESMRETLESCYSSLPYHIKYCFMYLSIFQEDLNIKRRRLVNRWIYEGFIMGIRGLEAEKLGESVFNEFLSRTFIQPTKYAAITSGRVTSCSIHPLMLHLSTVEAKKEKLVCILDNDHNDMASGDKIRHLVVRRNWSRDHEDRYKSMDLSRVRSLTVFGKWRPFFLSRNMHVLRALDLEGVEGLTGLDLEHIGEFQHLRYLGLRNTDIEHLPKSVGKLQLLETLDIRHTKVRTLPSIIGHLTKLRSLRGGSISLQADPTRSEVEMHEHIGGGDPWGMDVPKDIGKLQELKTLGTLSIRKHDRLVLQELSKLRQLQRLSVTAITDENGPDLCSTLQHPMFSNRIIEPSRKGTDKSISHD